MGTHWLAKAQRSWNDVTGGRYREQRIGRGRKSKVEKAERAAELAEAVRTLLTKSPHTFHQLQVALPKFYELEIRAILRVLKATRIGGGSKGTYHL